MHVGVEGSVEYFILPLYYRTSVFSVRQKKQTQQKQNIPAALKAVGNDFRRCWPFYMVYMGKLFGPWFFGNMR